MSRLLIIRSHNSEESGLFADIIYKNQLLIAV